MPPPTLNSEEPDYYQHKASTEEVHNHHRNPISFQAEERTSATPPNTG